MDPEDAILRFMLEVDEARDKHFREFFIHPVADPKRRPESMSWQTLVTHRLALKKSGMIVHKISDKSGKPVWSLTPQGKTNAEVLKAQHACELEINGYPPEQRARVWQLMKLELGRFRDQVKTDRDIFHMYEDLLVDAEYRAKEKAESSVTYRILNAGGISISLPLEKEVRRLVPVNEEAKQYLAKLYRTLASDPEFLTMVQEATREPRGTDGRLCKECMFRPPRRHYKPRSSEKEGNESKSSPA